jgi:hypothetical protein
VRAAGHLAQAGGVIISDIRNANFVDKATGVPLEISKNKLLWLFDFLEGVEVVKFGKEREYK